MSAISFAEFEKALGSLDAALAQAENEFIRDASIQRFEYTFELAWKTSRKVLAAHGVISNSPRSVFRDLGQQGWIQNVELWIGFLDSRNLTTHTYNEKTAQEVYQAARAFAPECRKLLQKLQSLAKP